jgi:hypothetical protein
MPRLRFSLVLAFFLAVFLVRATVAQEFARTAPVSLADMTSRAATIVHGRIVEAHLAREASLQNAPVAVVTMRPLEWIKGQPAPLFTFKQFMWDVRALYGVLPYRKGEELVLFMTAVSRYGLSSPVGLEQSRFEVIRRGAKVMVSNGARNAGLMMGVREDAQQRGLKLSPRSASLITRPTAGPIALDDFKQLARELTRSR